MYCYIYVTCLLSVPYRKTDLQFTGGYEYCLAVACGLGSEQFVELERSMYLNVAGRRDQKDQRRYVSAVT